MTDKSNTEMLAAAAASRATFPKPKKNASEDVIGRIQKTGSAARR